MDIRMWYARWRAANAAASSQVNVADVNTIDVATGVRPLTERAATAATKLGKRLDGRSELERKLKSKLAKTKREKIAAQVGLDAVTRVQDKVGH